MKKNYVNIYEEYKQKFYQIPKVFFTNEKYIDLSNNAKMAWGILRDRSSLSKKNNWYDKVTGNIYFQYSNESLQRILNINSRTTIAKIKKELITAELIEQKQVGYNQPNKLYLLYPEINDDDILKIDENETVVIPIKDGCPKNGRPENEHSDVQKMNTSNTDINNTNYLDTIKEDTKKIDTRKQQQEIYLLNHFAETHEEHSFLNKQNLELIGLFSDTLADAENMQGVILRAKKDVEKKQDAVLILDDGYLHDETLAIQEDIRKTLHRIYQKRKTDSTIKNIDNYTYGAFKNLFNQKLGEWKMLTSDTQDTVAMHDWV